MIPDLETLGAKLAFVGNGEPQYALAFREEQGITAPLYVSPDREAYKAFDFAKGAATTFGPATVAHAARAFLGGHRQGALQGAAFQQGGVVLVLPDGSVPWLYKSREAGDHPDNQAVLDAVRAATPPR